VILAAVIAAFVLDIGPGDTDPNAVVEVDDSSIDSATVTLTSYESGSTDGVAIVAEEDVNDPDPTDDDDNPLISDGEVVATLTTSGEELTFEWEDYPGTENWEPEDGDDVDFTVRSYAGEVDVEENIGSASDGQAIEDEFTLEDD